MQARTIMITFAIVAVVTLALALLLPNKTAKKYPLMATTITVVWMISVAITLVYMGIVWHK